MDYLEKIKNILTMDDSEDKVLTTIIDLISDRLKSRLAVDVIPSKLGYIVVEASISRFNRINDEGKTSAGESEVSATYQTDDLAPFKDDIQDWLNSNGDDTDDVGKFRFY